MLQSLRIRNLALLDEVELDFETGFTAVTGETGAGKSILLGALSLLAGARADKTIIRQGAPATEVEAALFFADSRKLDEALTRLDLPPCDDGVLILKRSLPRDKAPKISVNGSMATLAALQELGEYWIDFHGPGEPRRLLKEGCQRELLDLFAKNEAALDQYQKTYRHWRELVDERERLLGAEKLSADQIDFLKIQLGKIDALDLTEEAIAELERDFARQNSAQEIITLASGLSHGLSGEDGLLGRLFHAGQEELNPRFPVARLPHARQQVVIGLAMGLEEQAQVERRLAQRPGGRRLCAGRLRCLRDGTGR